MAQDSKQAGNRRVQQREIAARAGVAPSTVSRVLNASGTISPEVQQRVLAAASELGYRPLLLPSESNGTSELLASPHNGTKAPAQTTLKHIGLFADFAIIDPFHAGLLRGVEQECADQEIRLTFLVVQSGPGYADTTLAQIREQQIDGVILLSFDDVTTINAVLAQGLPAVLINTDEPDLLIDSYLPDNLFGSARAVRYLIAQGHRRIAHAGYTGRQTIRRRHLGYRIALEEAGLPYDPGLVFESSTNSDSAYQTLRAQLPERARDFTAIFCANDYAAIEAIRVLGELGLRVPHDVSVIGFDDIPPAALLAPPLTTMRLDFAELGARAVRGLLDRTENPSSPPVRFELASTLIERASVARLAPPATV